MSRARPNSARPVRVGPPRTALVFAALALALAGAALMALMVGTRPLAPGQVWAALVQPDATDPAHVVLRQLRLPRLAAGLVAGAALGLAGVLMQAVTRNPLAEPGLLGVNAGASFAVVLGAFLLGAGNGAALSALAFPGAALAAAAVFVLGGAGRGGAGPVRLTLAGAALTALLMSLVGALVLMRSETLDVWRFWAVASLADAGSRPLAAMAAVALAGGLLALALGPALDALALGEAAARSLGARTGWVRAGTLAAVTALCGAAVSLAGPVGFLGLMAPHLARALVGPGVRPMLLAAGLIGPLVLLLADVAGRVALPPGEVRVGVMTALLGGPVFILIARRMRLGAPA